MKTQTIEPVRGRAEKRLLSPSGDLCRTLLVAGALLTALGSPRYATGAEPTGNTWLNDWGKPNPIWRGIQLSVSNDGSADALAAEVPRLAALGVNVLVIEVDYRFAFESYPELAADRALTKAGATKLAKACREKGIRPIPLFNCLGHQSWAKTTFSLLAKHPELDETPGQYPENKGIYCRSWCPQHPDVNRIVFALVDELIEATEALIDAAQKQRGERMLGHLCTTWGAAKVPQLAEWPPIIAALKKWK